MALRLKSVWANSLNTKALQIEHSDSTFSRLFSETYSLLFWYPFALSFALSLFGILLSSVIARLLSLFVACAFNCFLLTH